MPTTLDCAGDINAPLAFARSGVDYSLCDADKIFGCVCDAGYEVRGGGHLRSRRGCCVNTRNRGIRE